MWSSLNSTYQCYGEIAKTSSLSTKEKPRKMRKSKQIQNKFLHKNELSLPQILKPRITAQNAALQSPPTS